MVAMEVAEAEFERRVMETVKAADNRGELPLVWAMEVGRCVREFGMGIPCLELGEVLVANLCFGNNTPVMWKLLDQAMASRIVFPIHTLALLTSRVIPHRWMQPEAYRLYLELLDRYINLSYSTGHLLRHEKITKCIDDVMRLSHTFGIQITNIGQTVVLFIFSVIISLIDSVLEDCGLHFESADGKFTASVDAACEMDIDTRENSNAKRNERHEVLRKRNVFVAIKTVERITANKSGKILLRLVHLNMPEKLNCLLQRMEFIEVRKTTSRNLIPVNHELIKLSRNVHDAVYQRPCFDKHRLIGSLIDVSPCGLSNYYNPGAGQTACWITFDIFLENSIDGRHLYPKSAVNILKELTMSLQVINQASWQETFKALWVSALRLVQREREPFEGPIPHVDARLCMLLAITPLAIASIIKEEETLSPDTDNGPNNTRTNNIKCMEGNVSFSRRHGLVSSLQLLGQFSGLLSPPPSVVRSANSAATKAAVFISNFKKGNDSFDGITHTDNSVKAIGNMLHLIVEACIARKLIDTSAYFWRGYVVVSSASSRDSMSVQESSWSAFMEGAQLSGSLKNSLMATPASSIVQVEKLYDIALNGSEEERSAAAKILCGASLTQGWNIQEHVVHFVVKLLSPPIPPNISESGSHLFGYMSMLNSILVGACCIDVVHIISLYGMVPDVAAALMPLCEVFGSVPPVPSTKSSTPDEPSVYVVFSFAFLFLLRLWKFYGVPQEHITAERWAHTELTLDYLLLMYNSRIASENSLDSEQSAQPVYSNSFPKLCAWYFQNQACMSSTLTGVCNANSVHQVANKIVNMICQKMTKVGMMSSNHSSTSSSSISGSPASMGEDVQHRLNLPAWEIMEAVPFVLEALLTACANARLSSRELTTGLRYLVDFLPASLATVLSYFSAEVTRGIWKPVPMNGTDWPSPAANLLSIESEIKEILASVGVNCENYTDGTVPVMLPLPMAALVGLTITFKIDKSLEYIHGVAGPALENCASCCPWPSMPVIGALWEQKARRWHDFITLSCARSPFRQDRDAICQLLKSCFESFLGSSASPGSHVSTSRGVNSLLGYAFLEHGARLPIAPGFLYIRSCRNFLDTRLVSHEIVKLVTASAREMASGWACSGLTRLKSNQVSLASAAAGVKQIATLGSSLLCATGQLRLVQVLYMETMPTWLICRRERKTPRASTVSCILEGYALAHLLILSGAFVWGINDVMRNDSIQPSRPRRARCISNHMDFIAKALEGDVSLGCDPVTWKAYVCCFLGLLVCFVPAWVPDANQKTLRKLANGLRGWHESELALSLIERGGPEAMTSVLEYIL